MTLNFNFCKRIFIGAVFIGFLLTGICQAVGAESYDTQNALQENAQLKRNALLETQLNDKLGAGGFLMAFNAAVNMNYRYEPGGSTEDYEEVWMRQYGDEGIYLGCNKAGYMMAIELFYSTEHDSLDPLRVKFMTTFKVLGIPEKDMLKVEKAFNDVMNTREGRLYDSRSNRTFICSRFNHWGDKQHYIVVIKAQKGDQTKIKTNTAD